MELGKLVTTESSGDIFYFIVDDVHPDEPRHEALKHYYVVTSEDADFTYREAYWLLCRAVCGVNNKTFLHRWHSLYEQIFGITPYVDFVNAVRRSPLVLFDSLPVSACANGHTGFDMLCRSSLEGDLEPRGGRISSGAVDLPAIFLDETVARRALRRVKGMKKSCSAAGAAADPHQGCCTPTQASRGAAAMPSGIGGEVEMAPPQFVERVEDVARVLPALPTRPVSDAGTAVICPNPEPKPTLPLAPAGQLPSGALQMDRGGSSDTQELHRLLAHERERRAEVERNSYVLKLQLEEMQRRKIPVNDMKPDPLELAEGCEKDLALLREQMRTMEQERTRERELHIKERTRLLDEMERLKSELSQRSHEQGALIEKFLMEHDGAVGRVEEAARAREDSVQAVYTQALQERDVRIAQLSRELLQTTHNARQQVQALSDAQRLHSERVKHLDGIADHLRGWNTSLQRQLCDANDEVRCLRSRIEIFETPADQQVRNSGAVPAAISNDEAMSCTVCNGLPWRHAAQLSESLRESKRLLQLSQEHIHRKDQELAHAAQVIDALKEGLCRVKLELRALGETPLPAITARAVHVPKSFASS